MVKIQKWDTSEYLDDPEMILEYLNAALEEDDEELMLVAIGNVAKAMGMSKIAEETNLSRQNLYKALTGKTSPKFNTMKKVIEALGFKLTVKRPEHSANA